MTTRESLDGENAMRDGPEDAKRPSPLITSVANRQPADPDSDSHSVDNDAEAPSHATKRKRPISVSCELCKQRKVKCDRGQPSCGWCKRNGAQCEYKERKPPGLRAGFGRFLENRSRELELRLDKMEEVLRKHSEILQSSPPSLNQGNQGTKVQKGQKSLTSDHNLPSIAGSLFGPSDVSQVSQTGTNLPHKLPPAFTNEPHQSVGLQNHPPTPGSHDRLHTPAKPPSITSSVETPDKQDRPSLQPRASVPSSQGSTNVSHSEHEDLPPYNLLYHLVDLYFKHINTWCPILNRKTTMDNLFGMSDLQEPDRNILHAIVATTMRFSTDPRLTKERRLRYHEVSKNKVVLYGMANSSVKSLLALVILALDLCGSSNGPPGWNIMALITRSIVQLGLAVETTSFSVAPYYQSIYTLRTMLLPEPTDFVEEEFRRRLFWMVYLLDRYATISTAFEFALDDKEVDRMLPCRDDLWLENQRVETRWFKTSHHDHQPAREHKPGKSENLSAFAFYLEILGILSKVHKFLKEPVDISRSSDVERWQFRYKELDKEMNSWNTALPREFGNMAKVFQPGPRNVSCNWIMLHATYHTAIIRLHSSAAYPTTRSPFFTPSFRASQKCYEAAGNIAKLGEFVVSKGFLAKLGPPFAFTIWVAARVLLVHGSTVEHRLSHHVSFFVNVLREMGRYWLVSERYSMLLQRVLDEHRESQREGDGITPKSITILADMRRTAFDLDLLISRQPRHGRPYTNGGGVTSVRTPAQNEFEYLDVFDFFNLPRLPLVMDNLSDSTDRPMPDAVTQITDDGFENAQHIPNEYNITNFTIDVNSDWLFKSEDTNLITP